MKTVKLACTLWMIMLITLPGPTKAAATMESAMANCREEAVSTGLIDESEITGYIDLCMQAWQDPAEYSDWNPETVETTNEPTLENQESQTD
jgi:hypothetical protein